MTDCERRQAYAEGAVVYATAQTLAFDYLRDSSCQTPENLFLPSTFGHVIIDEVDQILIDNALNPNIISGPDDGQTDVIFERIEKAASIAQGIIKKQMGVALGARAQNAALIQHLGTVLAGVGADVPAFTTAEYVNSTYKELSLLAHSALGHLPATLYAPDASPTVSTHNMSFRDGCSALSSFYGCTKSLVATGAVTSLSTMETRGKSK